MIMDFIIMDYIMDYLGYKYIKTFIEVMLYIFGCLF